MSDTHGTALDHRFVVRSPEPLAEVVREALAPLAMHTSATTATELIEFSAADGGWVMRVDGVDSSTMSSGRVMAHLLEHLNRRAADSLEHEIPFHAAAVEHPDGGVVALAGSSGSGKSTLGAAAVRSGWGFVAEEVAAVRLDDREVRPYHRPIGLRAGGASALGVSIPASDWFAEVYPWPVPADALRSGGRLLGIALVERTAGEAGAVDVRPSRALAELVEHTVVPSSERIVPVFRGLDRLVRAVPVVRLSSGESASTVRVLAELAQGWRG